MKTLSSEQKRIAELQGQLHAMRTCITALLVSMPSEQQQAFAAKLEHLAEWATANALGSEAPEEMTQAFADELQSIRALFAVR
ncbi:hypothetical protein [Alicycliphilus denitrificans]|uniref:hypothetical protein n=1 Tax=Alicycliphilus denitrificans TaxID=179636 RepID=UPI000C9EFDC6|nr:hypothetical protein [Alicycliphilus denitrificans]